MRPASSARHTHSLQQQQRRRRQQLHVGRRLRPAAATALAKKQEPAETAAATPLRRGAGRAASRRTGAHLRAALPPLPPPRSPPAVRSPGVSPERSGRGAARGERCPQPALRQPEGETAALRRPSAVPGGGRRRGAEESAGCIGVSVPPAGRVSAPLGERRARSSPGERRSPLQPEAALRPPGRARGSPQGLPEPRCRGRRARGPAVRDTAADPRDRERNAEREGGKGSPGK